MKTPALINKETIRLIREKTKVSYDYIYEKTRFSKDRIISWEELNNLEYPSFNQAKSLSKCYQVPFAGLFMKPEHIKMNTIPKLKNKRVVFGSKKIDDSTLNLAIINLLNLREFLIDTKNILKEQIINFKTLTDDDDFIVWANRIREYFNIEFDIQSKCSTTRKFYLYIREQIEKKDIIINCFKNVDIESIRAISIYFDTIPIIGINDADRYPAKTFSIIHELVHLLKRNSTYCNALFNSFEADQEEIFCNAVAGELLVPNNLFKKKLYDYDDISVNEDTVRSLAHDFSVSREVIIRRLLDIGYIDETDYRKRNEELKHELLLEREIAREKRKSNEYDGFHRNVTMQTIDRVSTNVFHVLYKGLMEGIFDKQDFSRYLNINHHYIDNILSEASKWGN